MLKTDLTQYQTLIFDCDGVILNSNKIKTQAFYDVAKDYGHEPAERLRDYHIENGGISRYKKFEFFFANILKRHASDEEIGVSLSKFSILVKQALLDCEVAKNIKELRKKTSNTKWLVVSGGDQAELRYVFKKKNLSDYFDGGIFGSPDDKNTILRNEINKKNISGSSLFIGDSIYDYQCSKKANIDFIFLSKWSDVKNHENYFLNNSYEDITSILNLID